MIVTQFVSVLDIMIDGGSLKEVSLTLLLEFPIWTKAFRGLGVAMLDPSAVKALRAILALWVLGGFLLFPERFGEEIGNVYVQYLGVSRESPRSLEKPGQPLLP